MKYAGLVLVAMLTACVGEAGQIDDPRTYALENDGGVGVCDSRAQARTEVLSRLGIDEAVCEARPDGRDACADEAPVQGPGTIVLTYAPYKTGTAVQVSREPGGGWWSVVCSCLACSRELGFDPSTWHDPHVEGL